MSKTAEEMALETEIEQLHLKQMRLRAQAFRERIKPQCEAAIGKTYVYRNNSYGHGENWDSFRKLLAIEWDEYHGWVIYEESALRDEGRARIEIAVDTIDKGEGFSFLKSGWCECDTTEYEENRRQVLEQFANPTKAIEAVQRRRHG